MSNLTVNFNNRELELSFGLKCLNTLDRALGLEVEQMSIGQGIRMLAPNLDLGNIVALGQIIKAGLSHHKNAPNDEDIMDILDEIEMNQGLEAFGKECLKELGKRPSTATLIPEEMQQYVTAKTKKSKKKEAKETDEA
ncbi:tail assembly chaperone [Salinicoccus roseus]|uniref:tail assembly chaperone n=1 Tax=Salinicoccus roseus TaxID=45670 RepID=UPI0023012E11|nr:tail assembly chaperone [Salinicoccus roseus]